MQKKKIIPAILTNDIKDLKDKLKRLKGLVDWVQMDILDGKFVNNISLQLKDLNKTDLAKHFNFEVHLMVLEPERYFKACRKARAKKIIFHLEAVKNMQDTLLKAGKFNFKKGVALNPETPITKIEPYLHLIDLALLLGVHPGFQSQQFIGSVLGKIKKLRKLAPAMKIEVDGGVNSGNIKKIAKAGADYLVIGSGLFKSKNIKERLNKLKEKIR